MTSAAPGRTGAVPLFHRMDRTMGGHSAATIRWLLILTLTGVVLVFGTVFSVIPDEIYAPWHPHTAIRYVHDSFDLSAYFRCGAWVALDRRPYADVFSEYPQLATYLFGLTHLLADTAHDPDLPRIPPGPADNRTKNMVLEFSKVVPHSFARFQFYHGLLMVPFFFVLALSVNLLARASGVERPWLWAMVLPAALFFTVNRFDVVPTALVALALVMVVHDRPYVGLVLLGAAGLTKWYPVVLVPAVVCYCRARSGRWPVGPVLAAGALVGAVLLHSIWWVRWDGFLEPYRFHAGRTANAESLFFLASFYVCGLSGADALTGPGWLVVLFAAGQFSGLVLGVVLRPSDPRRLVATCALSLVLFVIFAKFYSPQWIVWLAPLVVVLARRVGLKALLAAMDLATYAFYPVVFHLTWPVSTRAPAAAFVVVVATNLALKFVLGLMLVRELRGDRRTQSADDHG